MPPMKSARGMESHISAPAIIKTPARASAKDGSTRSEPTPLPGSAISVAPRIKPFIIAVAGVERGNDPPIIFIVHWTKKDMYIRIVLTMDKIGAVSWRLGRSGAGGDRCLHEACKDRTQLGKAPGTSGKTNDERPEHEFY